MEWIQRYTSKLNDFPQGFLDPRDLMSWHWFVWNFVGVSLLILFFSKNKKRSWRRLKAHLKSRRMRSEVSLDLQFFFLKIFYQPIKILLCAPIFLILNDLFKDLGLGLAQSFTSERQAMTGLAGYLFKALWVLLAFDFAYYWSHRIQHHVAFFWHLHSVHHRSTYLAPLLKYRTHPLDTLINNIFSFTLAAFAMGVFNGFYVLDGGKAKYDMAYIAAAFFSHYIFGHLRHSQYWLSYGPFLSRILISPAMHQIHHSTAPQHQGKNLGTMFSIWDLLFGTLYIPQRKEVLRFGDSPDIRHETKSLWGEVRDPFLKAWASLPGSQAPVWQKAAVVVVLLAGMVSCHQAQAKSEPCQELREVILPAVLLNAWPPAPGNKGYLPLPAGKCWFAQRALKIKDPFNQEVGDFIPEERWLGPLSVDLENKPENEIAFSYLKHVGLPFLAAGTLPELILGLVFPQEAHNQDKMLQIWRGAFRARAGYYFDDQNLKNLTVYKELKIVAYPSLLQELEKKSPIFTLAFRQGESWHIPTARPLTASGSALNFAGGVMPLSHFLNTARTFSAMTKEACRDKTAIFYGPIEVGPEFFNIYEGLRAGGCAQLSWFRGGFLEWNYPHEMGKYFDTGTAKMITGEEVRSRSEDTWLIDVRPASQYKEGHIPGAVNFPVLEFSASEFNVDQRPQFFNFSTEDYQIFLRGLKNKTKVIYYGAGKNVYEAPALHRLFRNLGRLHKITSQHYEGGYRDWLNRGRWLNGVQEYRVQKSTSK